MTRIGVSTLCAGLLLSVVAEARPTDPRAGIPLIEALGSTPVAARIAGAASLSTSTAADTVMYGGTCWAPDSARWEAIRDSVWTFDSGVGSAFGDTGPNKPPGYHTLMEGWYGIDRTLYQQPWFRRSQNCVIDGSWSFWAGLTEIEAAAYCFVDGQGYGNSWVMVLEKAFAYPGSGSVTMEFDFAIDSEPGYDYTYVLLDSSGTVPEPSDADLLLAAYDGVNSGHDTIVIPVSWLPDRPCSIIIKFVVASDGGYSDEDGLYPTTCGHTTVDNIVLSGAITDAADFETGSDGWAQFGLTTGAGDFSNLASLDTDLPPPTTYCPCAVQDSVLVFYDDLLQHPLDQNNLAASPWIDLKRGGDVNRPGKIILFDAYLDLPYTNYVYIDIRARYYPAACGSGTYLSPWKGPEQVIYWSGLENPFCNSPGSRNVKDFSAVIESSAEQVQIAVGVINLCSTAPYGVPCTGVTNSTPWFDNIALGVCGEAGAPVISILTYDLLQDNFATDGTLNPASPGRLDTNRVKNAPRPEPGSILADTLVVGGDGGNTEVRVLFRVRPGPFTSEIPLALWAASRWTPEAALPAPGWLGNTWYSARMDTAEQGGLRTSGRWMGTFHESDPGFMGSDRAPDPVDPSQLENEIFPDHILTPGSRIDYFFAARYIPPDPRNPGGDAWCVLPDTSGGRCFEVEILPSSMAADTTWNCTLYVDHHADRSAAEQFLEEEGLTGALGTGGANAEATRYDRFDVQTPSSDQLSFGRALRTHYGASLAQAWAYRSIAWHSSILSATQLTPEDAGILTPWLTFFSLSGNRFWGSGDGLVRSMNASGSAVVLHFLNSVCGVLYSCDTIRGVNCPTGSALDSTYCLPLCSVSGSAFPASLPAGVRGNGCPELRSFDLITPNPSVGAARGQVGYVKGGAEALCASVSNLIAGEEDARTVLDGFPVGQLRRNTGDPHSESLCRDASASLLRTGDVLGWFGSPQTCALRSHPDGVPEDGDAASPPARTTLGGARPNPMQTTTRISLVNGGAGGPVRLQVLDVTGRLVRTLLDAPLPAGPREVIWDGCSDRGAPVASGLYFYRLTARGYAASNKIIVIR